MCVSEMDESDKSIYCVSNPIRVGLLFFRVSTAVLYRVGLQSYPSRIYRGLRSPVLETLYESGYAVISFPAGRRMTLRKRVARMFHLLAKMLHGNIFA